MKRFVALIVILIMLLTGCGWMDGEYHSVKPHLSGNSKESNDAVTISEYVELRDALVDLVNDGRQKITFRVVGIDEDMIDQYVNTAIMHIFQNSAVGAYAVDEINYEYGASGEKSAIAVEVSYLRSRNEILRIKSAENMDGVKASTVAALKKCEASAVIKVKNYDDVDLVQFVEDYASSNPDICMETPKMTVNTYPDRGDERVVEMIFTYKTSRDQLRNMQEIVAPIFSSAQMYVQSSETQAQKYEQLYAFLMERFDYTLETSITPAYSLLRYGVGDSRAFAMVYATMCRNAELECQVIPGSRNGEPWYWNMVCIDDVYYHVDLLACVEAGAFTVVLPEDMIGYVWDYSNYE